MGLYDKVNTAKETAKPGKVVYVDGISKSVMKKIAKYEFGNAVSSINILENGRAFCVILTEAFPEWQLEKFKNHWKTKLMVAT
jgi:hypothetical protein